MLPHQALLNIPSLRKHRRRTIPFGDHVHDNKCILFDSKETINEIYIRELNIAENGLGCAIWDGSIVLASRYNRSRPMMLYFERM